MSICDFIDDKYVKSDASQPSGTRASGPALPAVILSGAQLHRRPPGDDRKPSVSLAQRRRRLDAGERGDGDLIGFACLFAAREGRQAVLHGPDLHAEIAVGEFRRGHNAIHGRAGRSDRRHRGARRGAERGEIAATAPLEWVLRAPPACTTIRSPPSSRARDIVPPTARTRSSRSRSSGSIALICTP